MVQTHSLTKPYDCVIIVGPTASGKTKLAIELAKQINGEIINADSQQIYKQLSIGTAKPTIQEQEGIRHHLLDIVDPTDTFSVAEYKKLATEAIANIQHRNKLPIVVGGTGYYIDSLLYDQSYGLVEGNAIIRDKYNKLATEKGNEHVHSILKAIDSVSASKIHPNDIKRVIRALEIYEITGKSMSSTITKSRTALNPLIIYINMDRNKLYKRIEQRVDTMINSGLEQEVKQLLNKDISFDNQCMQAIGYKEWQKYFAGEQNLPDTIELIKKNTRHYAKRQITWFNNSLPYSYKFDIGSTSLTEIINTIIDELNKKHD